mmetsp:Transcript_391/g.980  ORF Transcript_391/g.980 Transcript_391/m.980 type:complete len:276 (-) Transcript_391:1298-2125(-)
MRRPPLLMLIPVHRPVAVSRTLPFPPLPSLCVSLSPPAPAQSLLVSRCTPSLIALKGLNAEPSPSLPPFISLSLSFFSFSLFLTPFALSSPGASVRATLPTPYLASVSVTTYPKYFDASSLLSTCPSSSNCRNCASVNPPSLLVPDRAERNTSQANSPPSSASSSSTRLNTLSSTLTTGFLPKMKRENRAPVALERFSRVLPIKLLHSSHPARSSASNTSKPSASSPLVVTRLGSPRLHAVRDSPFSSSVRRNAMRLLSGRSDGRHICSKHTPAL